MYRNGSTDTKFEMLCAAMEGEWRFGMGEELTKAVSSRHQTLTGAKAYRKPVRTRLGGSPARLWFSQALRSGRRTRNSTSLLSMERVRQLSPHDDSYQTSFQLSAEKLMMDHGTTKGRKGSQDELLESESEYVSVVRQV